MKIEAYLATFKVGYTVLRPYVFRHSDSDGPTCFRRLMGGAAAHGRFNRIDTRDIAEVVRVALLDDKDVAGSVPTTP